VDTKSSKIAEIKSLCGSIFLPPLRDTVFQRIQLDIKQKGNEFFLDDYLRALRSGKTFLRLGPKISQKADTWKGFQTPHPGLFDLPLEAKTIGNN